MNRRRSVRGFTLIEVLSTLVFVAIVLPLVMQGISLATNAASLARRNLEAAALAEEKLSELVATQEWSSGSLSGDFGEDWPDYKWTAETVSRDTELMELTIRVTWESRGDERSVSVTTMAFTGGLLQ